MSLNKQRGNMYNWATHTWNPLGGECPHKCVYCSTRRLCARHETLRKKYTGEPRLIEKELKYNHGTGKTIFVCNMVDLFADAVPEEHISAIMAVCRRHPESTYLLQTKNPQRFISLLDDQKLPKKYYPKQVIFATTIETNRDEEVVGVSLAPKVTARAEGIAAVERKLTGVTAHVTVTIEPIMPFDIVKFESMIRRIRPNFVSVGADSSRTVKIWEPDSSNVHELLIRLSKFTEIRSKSNLNRLL